MDVQGVRERVLRIGRIGQVIKDDEPLATDLCTRWLICECPSRLCSNPFDRSCVAQLKVNLRPLWSPAAEALSSLAKRFGDSVWACLFDELQAVTKATHGGELPEWLNKNVEQDVNDDPWEEERTWRDGAAHKIRNVIASWLDHEHDEKAIILVSVGFQVFGGLIQHLFLFPNRIRNPLTDSILFRTRRSCSQRLDNARRLPRSITANSFRSSCRWRSTTTQFRVFPATN